jgi:hypothetical protein
VKVIEVTGKTSETIGNLWASTNYIFAVKAVNASGDLTPFASKAISTAKWIAPSGLKANIAVGGITVTGNIPAKTAWEKDSVNGTVSYDDAFSRLAVYYLNGDNVEVFLGFVNTLSIPGTATGKMTTLDATLLSGLTKAEKDKIKGNNVTFFIKAVETTGVLESDITNSSLGGKFAVSKALLA